VVSVAVVGLLSTLNVAHRLGPCQQIFVTIVRDLAFKHIGHGRSQDSFESSRWMSVDTLPPPAPSRPQRTASNDRAPVGVADVEALGASLIGTMDAVIAGKHDVVEIAVATLLAGGNLLIEDIPGVGKTLLAQVLARAVGGTFSRIQGTSDLLPGDITGSMIPTADGFEMRFRPGPVFANVVVFDEMNRATPRTQSALLELAEEATVTVDGVTHNLPTPFLLVATQNPIDVAGTYGLGEGALDRFAAVITPGRATAESELEILTGRRGRQMLGAVEPVASTVELLEAQRLVSQVHVSDAVAAYVVDLNTPTNPARRVYAWRSVVGCARTGTRGSPGSELCRPRGHLDEC